jgi:hypothetical protein
MPQAGRIFLQLWHVARMSHAEAATINAELLEFIKA